MIAPVDATAEIMAGDDTVTLKADFASLAAAKAAGLNLFNLSGEIDPLDAAPGLAELAKPHHADFNAGQALALLMGYPDETFAAIEELLKVAFGDGDDDPKPKSPPKKRAT